MPTDIFLPAEVRPPQPQEEGLPTALLELNLCYDLRTLTLGELNLAQLKETVGCHSQRFTQTVLAQFGIEGELTDSQHHNPLSVTSAFALPEGLYARVYQYGFAPSVRLRHREGLTTKEFGLNGKYIRRYFNLRCMVSGEHILEYDGVEHGIFRLNSDFSAGREVVDTMYRVYMSGR